MYFKVLERNTVFAVSILIYLILNIVSAHPIDQKYAIPENSKIIMNQKNQDSFGRTLEKSTQHTTGYLLENSTFLLQPNSSVTSDIDSDLCFLVLVHSKPENFENRRIIRETWGSVSEIEGRKVKVVFLIGNSPHPNYTVTNYKKHEDRAIIEPKSLNFDDLLIDYFSTYPTNSIERYPLWTRKDMTLPIISSRTAKAKAIMKKRDQSDIKDSLLEIKNNISAEQHEFGDLVQGNFIDNDNNSVRKHLLGLKWIQQNFVPTNMPDSSKTPPFFHIKADDDVFIEIYHLFKFVKAIFGNQGPKKKSLVCDVIPRDAKPRGGHETKEDMLETVNYPEYCNGMAYLMTPDLIPEFIKASNEVTGLRTLENDDMFITGVLREKLGFKPFYLNLRYSYDKTNYLRWLQGSAARKNSNLQPLPYLFVKIGNGADWQDQWRNLWTKTMQVHATETKVDQMISHTVF